MHSDEVGASVRTLTVGLIGNPNSGKSSVFNRLTGLRQKVGNFPGVTVDKKMGTVSYPGGLTVRYIDFPGTYSLYPTSQDERIVAQVLTHPADEAYPDAVLYVADITRLEKHLLLFTQLRDLGLPLILALNMADQAEREGLTADTDRLSRELGTPVVRVSSRTGAGFDELARLIGELAEQPERFRSDRPFHSLSGYQRDLARQVRQHMPDLNDYHALLLLHHHEWLPFLSAEERNQLQRLGAGSDFVSLREQVSETMGRYDKFTPLARQSLQRPDERPSFTGRLDNVLTHPVFGPLIFFALMLLVFQAIYAWATYPMDAIEWFFGTAGETVREVLPAGWFTDLLVDGILAGLGGILVFAPQIAILFFLITLLEEVGYMARAAYMFDRLMQSVGLNGRSIVALISGHACAIPAVMSTRTISNWKERLLTILVTPLTSCSARIPVYTVLIGFVVPAATVGGIFNLQGLAFMGLYLLGIGGAMFSALLFKKILRTPDRSFLMLELPEYRSPVWRNVGITVWEKVRTFAVEAGKVILLISIVLWVLSSYGPSRQMEAAEAAALTTAQEQQLDETATEDLVAANRLEASWAGHIGKAMEPAIRPLGYDWKIGIAILSSFAAREVFVGTMATIYSIGSTDDEFSVRTRLAAERNPATGEKVYTRATAASLLIFYVFAMMCMSTLAVVKRETKSWKWPTVQFFFMTGLAYVLALITYQVLA